MTAVVLNASALLHLLKNKPGGVEVAEVIATSLISSVNYAEVVSHTVR